MELTVPRLYFALNSASCCKAFTISWQSSNIPLMAMLWIFLSSRLYICARWNSLILPWGDIMNTSILSLPRSAYSAAEPVSPDVAPMIVRRSFFFFNTYSKALPKNCMAMSLNASVGPFDNSMILMPSLSVRTGVISGLPNACTV